MLALGVETSIKDFMACLLRNDVFDGFEIRSAEITAKIRVLFDGTLEKEDERTPYTMDAIDKRPGGGENLKRNHYITWGELRPHIYAIIKNGQKPRSFKIVFSCDTVTASAIHDNAAALFLNMLYENDRIVFTTATAQKQFALEKSLDIKWDGWVTDFFDKIEIKVKALQG